MNKKLKWKKEKNILILKGYLDRDTLLPLWQQRKHLLKFISVLDVSKLLRIDSAGIALIIHFCNQNFLKQNSLTLIGITKEFYSLITLYKLQDILCCNNKSK